jgi:hypothetical protein
VQDAGRPKRQKPTRDLGQIAAPAQVIQEMPHIRRKRVDPHPRPEGANRGQGHPFSAFGRAFGLESVNNGLQPAHVLGQQWRRLTFGGIHDLFLLPIFLAGRVLLQQHPAASFRLT